MSRPYCAAIPAVLANPRFNRATLTPAFPKIQVLTHFQGLAPQLGGRLVCENNFKASGELVAGEYPTDSALAGRYATALFELALEAGALDPVLADLKEFDALLDESADLLRLVRSPVFTADVQSKALVAVLDEAGITGLAARFLMVVTSNRRLFAVRDIVRAYRALVARHKGEVTAYVTVAEPLADAHKDEIRNTLNAVTGKDVQVDVKVDPSIIGGLVVKLGSRMVDSSLRTKLNVLKHAMKEVG
jgi:F-type H+-transporting ATPase subunit delta